MCARDRLYDDDEKNRYKSRQRRERKGKKTVQLQSLPGKNREKRKEKWTASIPSSEEQREKRKAKEKKKKNPNLVGIEIRKLQFFRSFFGELGDSNHFYRVRLNRHPFWLLSHPPVAAATPPILFYCQIQAFDLPKYIMREKQRLIDLLITN